MSSLDMVQTIIIIAKTKPDLAQWHLEKRGPRSLHHHVYSADPALQPPPRRQIPCEFVLGILETLKKTISPDKANRAFPPVFRGTILLLTDKPVDGTW